MLKKLQIQTQDIKVKEAEKLGFKDILIEEIRVI